MEICKELASGGKTQIWLSEVRRTLPQPVSLVGGRCWRFGQKRSYRTCTLDGCGGITEEVALRPRAWLGNGESFLRKVKIGVWKGRRS